MRLFHYSKISVSAAIDLTQPGTAPRKRRESAHLRRFSRMRGCWSFPTNPDTVTILANVTLSHAPFALQVRSSRAVQYRRASPERSSSPWMPS